MNADVTEAPSAPDATSLAGRRIDRRMIGSLYAGNLISPAARDHALALIEPPRNWGLWASRILTVFGVALMLAGIVYFFAFNWDHIPPLAKLAGIAGLMLAAIAGVGVYGLAHPVGRIATTVATVLTGVFLAVFGQIYQTGADAWGLFYAWALLTLPWALLSTSAPTWAVWLTVADLAIWLWWEQVHPRGSDSYGGLNLSIMLFDGAFLVAREILARWRFDWVAGRWTRLFLALPVLATATMALLAVIVDHYGEKSLQSAAAGVAAAAYVAVFIVYRRLLPDVWILAAAVVGACIVVVVGIFEVLNRASPGADVGAFFLTGLLTLVVFALGVAWLRAVARDIETREEATHHG